MLNFPHDIMGNETNAISIMYTHSSPPVMQCEIKEK
jgi:hypothetical protein